MKIALSLCPNDTFLFHAWIKGLVGQNLLPSPIFADIEQLNEWAIEGRYPLTKLSFNCFSQVVHHYQLLPVGTALGFNCGPKIIARTPFSLAELSYKTIAVPGKLTTANLLLNRLGLKPKKKHYCLYHEIASLIDAGEVECGLIIHESRFTFQQAGFVEIADLGQLWNQQTSAPLPLGGLAIARNLPEATKNRIVSILRQSLQHAYQNPDQAQAFILYHSQEKQSQIVDLHIATYVNDETLSLSAKGISSIKNLLDCSLPSDWLYSP